MPESLGDLFRACTVQVDGHTHGTGFFAAPGMILTCAHVVGENATVMVRWEFGSPEQREPQAAQVVEVLANRGRRIPALDSDYPDLAVLAVDGFDGHPCVGIETEEPVIDDSCLIFGYPEEGQAVLLTPASLIYSSPRDVAPTRCLDLKGDKVLPGMSGSALLNRRTRKVCGVIVATRGTSGAHGGLAVPFAEVETDLSDVLVANRDFHQANHRWAEAASQPDPVVLSELLRRHCSFVDRATGGLPRLADLGTKVTAIQLRVHEAQSLDLPAGGIDSARSLPAYVRRDIDEQLDAAIAGGGLVLLRGDSMAGKSRTAYEAMRRMPGNTRLLVPAKRDSLRELTDGGARLRDTVVWLNDLERYLGPRGLDVDTLVALTGPETQGVVVLATMRDNEYNKRLSGPEDESRMEDELLEQATVIELKRLLSEAEKARAAELAGVDPRIRAASEHEKFGLAEYLGAGPQLSERWQSGQGTSNPPNVQVGSAIISAAIDCRRAGLARPAPEPLLESLYPGYLVNPRDPMLKQARFDAGLAKATEPIRRTTVACLAFDDDGYRASDYLLDKMQNDEAADPVPDMTWQALLAEIEPPEAWGVGREAYWASRAAFAENAFRLGLCSDDQAVIINCAQGMAELARLLDNFDEARAWRLRAEHPESLPADSRERSELGRHLVESKSEEWYLRAAHVSGDRASALVIEHEHVVLAFDGQDYRHTITRHLRNDSFQPIDRYPFRIAVARYPNDQVKNEEQYRKYPLTVEGSQISACHESEALGRQPMHWEVERERDEPSFKEMWLLFKNAEREFPLLHGESAAVTYQYIASSQHWGPWSKRKVRLKTGKLSLEFSFPAWMLPEIEGFGESVAKTPIPMDATRRQDGDRVVFTWEALNPPVNAQFQFNWRLGNDPDNTTTE